MGDIVKYMLMLYGSQQDYDVLVGKPTDKPAMSAEHVAAMHKYMESIHNDLVESGELVDAQGLTAPVHARMVQLENRAPVVTDGLHAVRAHLLEMAGDRVAARDAYEAAARRTTSLPQQRYLHARSARLAEDR